MAQHQVNYYSDPNLVMDPRNLGAMQPNRLSASRSFMSKMINQNWQIEREQFEVDLRGNGHARYVVTTPEGSLTFLAYLKEPSGENRTGRIIGTAWDMSGALIDGIVTPEEVEAIERELPRLYEGRATPNTLVWFRSNQSLRIFRNVRQSLARGEQPDPNELKRVGYVMRNTGLDGNGTFGTISFAAITKSHPLATSYHAQMLAAYLMRELSVDLVEQLAFKDAPSAAVRLDPSAKRLIGVGNGSALGLAMFVYNRPILVNAYISAFLKVLDHALTEPSVASHDNLDLLEQLLNRTINYRSFLTTSYRFFSSNTEIAGDLRRIRAQVRAAKRGAIEVVDGTSALAVIHRNLSSVVSKEAIHSFNSLLLELVPEFCDEVAATDLDFTEELDLDPQIGLDELRNVINTDFRWALDMPLNDGEFRDRVWYQSRAAEEPRSGPREEVPEAHELIPSYPVMIRNLVAKIGESTAENVGGLVGEHPELEHITRLVLNLRDKPYSVPHADPHDTDFVPVWAIRFVNSFIHGLDRTEDHMGRDVRGIIFESAPYRDELGSSNASAWWWSYQSLNLTSRVGSMSKQHSAKGEPNTNRSARTLAPTDTPITPPCRHETEKINMKYREVRLLAGRVFQALNLPEGSWHGAREFVISAMAADVDAVTAYSDLLIRTIDPLTALAAPWQRPTSKLVTGELVIDNQNQSLLTTGHVLVNMLGAHAADNPQRFSIVNAVEDHALAGIGLELGRYGIALIPEIAVDSTITGAVSLAANQEKLRNNSSVARAAFKAQGRVVSATSFWNIFYRSNAGLYADTPISRQHTGSTLLDVIKPGDRITKQFTSEELHLLTDPDDLDNQGFADFADSIVTN